MTNNLYGLLRGVNSHIHTGLKLTTYIKLNLRRLQLYGNYPPYLTLTFTSHTQNTPAHIAHDWTLGL